MRRLLVPLLVVGEVLACTALLASSVLSPLTNRWLARHARKSGRAAPPPVLLVHGYGMTRGSMLVLGLRLARAGYRPIAVGYHWLRSPKRAAERVARRAAQAAATAGVSTVDVVAHSLGGLVARAARSLLAGSGAAAAIGRIITLGTPHRGEWWGHMPIGPMAAEMRAGAYAGADAGDLAITSYGDLVIRWHRATSHGLPYAGALTAGTQLPVDGPDWVTWDPVTDSVPNQPRRLYGNEHTIRTVVSVLAAYRTAHPDAPRVVVGDISFRGGGPMDEHRSHQNGLDVDVYYPRQDGALRAPVATAQIDRGLAQDLLDRFVAAGAQMVFVGFSTGLHGPGGVVIPYPNHEDHMHVRFLAPPA
jgi:pimeloyl-ACP methyl ester carboxylesterase